MHKIGLTLLLFTLTIHCEIISLLGVQTLNSRDESFSTVTYCGKGVTLELAGTMKPRSLTYGFSFLSAPSSSLIGTKWNPSSSAKNSYHSLSLQLFSPDISQNKQLITTKAGLSLQLEYEKREYEIFSDDSGRQRYLGAMPIGPIFSFHLHTPVELETVLMVPFVKFNFRTPYVHTSPQFKVSRIPFGESIQNLQLRLKLLKRVSEHTSLIFVYKLNNYRNYTPNEIRERRSFFQIGFSFNR